MSISTVAIDMLEWEERSPEADKTLAGVSLSESRAVRAVVEELTRSGRLEIHELRSGLLIKTTSYVGKIGLGDLSLTIRPKIPFDPLLTLLRYAFKLRDLKLFTDTAHSAPPEAFQELLIHQLRVEAAELVARGLRRRYTQVDETLTAPRGRIDVQRVARQAGVIEAAIPCTHYPRLEDTLVNRVLLAGLGLASQLTDDLILRTSLRRLAALIAEHVSRVRLDAEVMRRVNREMNRLTSAYQPAMTLIALLMEAIGITLDEAEPGVRLPGFLFNMNDFFEALMARFLRENLPGYVVRDQYQLRGLMAYALGHNPRHRQAPTPRPDFVVLQNGTMVAMLDTKYRDIWDKGLPRDMLYQLAIYALSQGFGGSAIILYPTLDPFAKPEVIDIREAVYAERRAQVILRPVDLTRLQELISASGAQAERQRRAYAGGLISFDTATSPLVYPG